ncbi:DMT family transporter [uncultured Robinsoniella sp.]|uniref:DMT family transporter n=1 Tax=uncultured Robinsoniella sp. TaxID=904190 RepID=UPI00374FB00D
MKKEAGHYLTNPWLVGLLAVISTALWGSAYPCVKSGYEIFRIADGDIGSKILFAGYRFFLAGVMTFIFVWILKKKFPVPGRKMVPGILGLGVVQTTIQYIFFYIGVANTTGVKGSIISASNSFFTILLAHFLMKSEKLNIQKCVGCLLGFGGVMLTNFSLSGWDASFSFQGEGFLLISALAYSVASLWSKRLAQNEDPILITALQLLFGGALLMGIGIISGGKIVSGFSATGIILLLYMAFISSAAFSIWTILLKYNPVGKVAIYGFMIPVFGVFLSAVFLQENAFTLRNLGALILVSAGIIAVNRRKL